MNLELEPCPAEVHGAELLVIGSRAGVSLTKSFAYFHWENRGLGSVGKLGLIMPKPWVGNRVHSAICSQVRANTWPMPQVTPPRAPDAGRVKGKDTPPYLLPTDLWALWGCM